MPPRTGSRFGRMLRYGWRGVRIIVQLLILALLGALIYLNQSGLPDFAKRPLLEKLRARGLDLEISRLRLQFYRGLVAENVRFGPIETASGPHLTAKNVEVKIDYRALLHRQLQVTAVVLDQGRLAWLIADSNPPPRVLVVENIRVNLRLLPGDEWELDHFHAAFAGADFTLSGNITNASDIRDWPLLQGKQPAGAVQRRLKRFADVLKRIHFREPPELRFRFSGDAKDLRSFSARLTLDAPDADTPWGKISRGVFSARLFPGTNDEPVRAELRLQASSAQTPWATAAIFDLGVHLLSPVGQTNVVDAGLTAKAEHVETRWVSATNVQFTANWSHSLTNVIPLSGRGELRAAAAAGSGIGGKDVYIAATLATPPKASPADATWAWWTNLAPYQLDWAGEWSQLQTEKLDADKVTCAGQWRPPELMLTNLHASFPDGALDVRAGLNVATRAAQFDLTSSFDVQKISPLLVDKSRLWLEKFTWRTPPKLAGHGDLILPAWTNRQPDWRSEVLPSLRLAGEVFVTNGAYLGLPADWAHTHFTYSNLVWCLPDLEAVRPEGQLQLTHIADERTRDYYWRVHSTIDVRAVQSLLTTKEQRGFDLVTFSQPPVIDGEVWEHGHESDRIGFQGHVTLTNFSVREQTASWFESSVRFTNRFLEFLDPRLQRGTQSLAATGIAVDFNTQRIHFTNGFSTAEPLVVARAIGDETARTVEPYVFTQPPRVQVNGYAPLHGSSDADLRFDVEGGPFEWWKFKLPHVTGRVHWMGETLTLTNAHASFYGGDAAGFAHFDFTSESGTDFGFVAGVTNANLPSLLADVAPRTNHLEGDLSGWVAIAHANSAEPRSWAGEGRANLRDGLVWEVPIFGVLSKPLDAFMPGVAETRFSEASARFTLTNGVIDCNKLEMRSPAMRLQYNGTVDFQGQVDMRVEAEPLRDAWVVGRIFRYALWPVSKLFQFQISGTLDKPKSEPVYVPKLLLMPLHPIRTLEDLFFPESPKTNAPPVFKDVP